MFSPQIKFLKIWHTGSPSATPPTSSSFYKIWAILQLIKEEGAIFNSFACSLAISPLFSTYKHLDKESRVFCSWKHLPGLAARKFCRTLGFPSVWLQLLDSVLKSFYSFYFNNTVNIFSMTLLPTTIFISIDNI